MITLKGYKVIRVKPFSSIRYLRNMHEIAIQQIFASVFSHYQSYIVMLLEFLVGLGLGYATVRAAKYLIMMFLLTLLGALLGLWSLGSSLQDILMKLLGSAEKIWSVIYTLLVGLGILTIGPGAIGFIVGVILALRK